MKIKWNQTVAMINDEKQRERILENEYKYVRF